MFATLLQGLLNTKPPFISMAFVVCSGMALTLVILLRQVGMGEGRARLVPLG